MEDFRAAGAHTITAGRIFLKQGKKSQGPARQKYNEWGEKGPSREEWNFPQVQCIYVGLAGPFNKEMMLRRFDVYQAELSFSNLFTSWPGFPFSCSLFLSFCPHTQDVKGCVSWKWRQQQFVRAILKPRQNSHSSDDTALSFPWSEPRTIVGKTELNTFPPFFSE